MSEKVLELRDRLIEDLSYHGIGTKAEVPLGALADFGLMNGAMIVRASGLYLSIPGAETCQPIDSAPDCRQALIDTSFAVTSHIATLSDREGNAKMARIFGDLFVQCFMFMKRTERVGRSPYNDSYPRAITDEDQRVANELDSSMAATGAAHLTIPDSQPLLLVQAPRPDRGCPLHYERKNRPSELEHVIESLVSEYFDPESPFYGKGFHGIGNLALLAVQRSQPRDPSWATDRYDWLLPSQLQQHS